LISDVVAVNKFLVVASTDLENFRSGNWLISQSTELDGGDLVAWQRHSQRVDLVLVGQLVST
jgi:hypothetical protein